MRYFCSIYNSFKYNGGQGQDGKTDGKTQSLVTVLSARLSTTVYMEPNTSYNNLCIVLALNNRAVTSLNIR